MNSCCDCEAHIPMSRVSPLYEVIDLCLPSFELPAIVSLSCSSKHCSSLCHTLLRHRLQCVLPNAVAQAAAEGLPEAVLQKRICVVNWILKTAGSWAITKLSADSLMCIPSVPAAVADALVGAGLRVQYQQLMEAARNRVEGCEVWVQPYKALCCLSKEPFTLPSWALQICCNKPLDMSSFAARILLLPATLPDMLQLSFNNQHPAAAEELVGLLVSLRDNPICFQQWMQQLTAPLVDNLLQTAVLRQHTDVIAAFDGLVETAAPGTISAGAVASYLSAAVETQQNEMVHTLSQMHAAQRLEPAAVAVALQTAMQHEYHAAVPYLTKLPALRQLDAAGLCMLLHTAVVHFYSDVVSFLCKQQAALHIGPDAAVIDLLSTAIHHDEMDSLQHLVQLQPAWQLHAPQVAALLETAVRAQSGSAVELLCDELPAALEIEANRAVELLHSAIQQPSQGSSAEQILQGLCWLPATQQIAAAALQQLLAAAVARKHIPALKALGELPGATELSFRSFWDLVWQAFDSRMLHHVLPHLPLHHHVLPHNAAVALQDSYYIGTVLERAAEEGYYEAIEAVGKLEAAKSIPPSSVASWLSKALASAAANGKAKPSNIGGTSGRDEQHKVMAALCKLKLAQRMSDCSITHLLELALKQQDHKALEILAGAKSASGVKIDACSAAGLLWYVMQRGDFEAFVILCGRLKPAKCIDPASIAGMLPFVEQFGKEDQEQARKLLHGVAAHAEQGAAAQQPVPAGGNT